MRLFLRRRITFVLNMTDIRLKFGIAIVYTSISLLAFVDDPSTASPTGTLLRLLLPLDARV